MSQIKIYSDIVRSNTTGEYSFVVYRKALPDGEPKPMIVTPAWFKEEDAAKAASSVVVSTTAERLKDEGMSVKNERYGALTDIRFMSQRDD